MASVSIRINEDSFGNIWKSDPPVAFLIDDSEKPVYSSDQMNVNYPQVFATVTFTLKDSLYLRSQADRALQHQEWSDNGDYTLTLGISDINGKATLDNCITAFHHESEDTVLLTFDDKEREYAEMVLAAECQRAYGRSPAELLAESRNELEKHQTSTWLATQIESLMSMTGEYEKPSGEQLPWVECFREDTINTIAGMLCSPQSAASLTDYLNRVIKENSGNGYAATAEKILGEVSSFTSKDISPVPDLGYSIFGFAIEEFMEFMDEKLKDNQLHDSHYTRELIENLVNYAENHEHTTRDSLAYFLSDIIPDVEFGDVAAFCRDDILTSYGLEMKKSHWDCQFRDDEEVL